MSLCQKLGFGLLLLLCASPAVAQTATEDEVKLALVYNMTRFVNWPDSANDETFQLCLAGETAYDLAVENLRGRKIGERDIEVRLLENDSAAPPTCDLVYVTSDEADFAAELLNQYSGLPVLMVSDAPDFIEDGGMVALSFDGGRVGMTISVAAYERVGLTISSQLLELAQVVDTDRSAGG